MEIFRMSIQKIKEKHMYTQIWQRKRNDEGKWCEQWQKRKINENENENEFPNNRNSFLLQKFLIVDAHSTTDKTTTTSDRWEHTEKQRYCKTTEKFFDYKTHATIGKSGKCSILLWLNVSTLPWELLQKKKITKWRKTRNDWQRKMPIHFTSPRHTVFPMDFHQ